MPAPRPRAPRSLLAAVLSTALALPAASQDAPFHASQVGHFDEPGSSYADVWADGDFVYLAHWLQSRIDIVDLSNPATPVKAATYSMTSPDGASSAQDVKVGDGLLFVALELADPNGVEIVDVRDPYAPQFLSKVDAEPGFFEQIHNVFYDGGWLYMDNSADNTVAVLDLRAYDPDNAPASITAWDYRLQNVGDVFVHDVTTQDGRLYCSAWGSLEIYDVSSIGAQAPQWIGAIEGMNTHAAWATADGQFVVTAEERQGGALRLYELIDGGGALDIVQRDSYAAPFARSFSSHNPLIAGDRVYASYYQGGGLVLELDRTSKTLELVASFDTSVQPPATGFEGSWGVYPFLGADRVLFSDIDNGMFVVDMSAIQIGWAAARPLTVQANAAETLTVELTELGNSVLDPSSVTLHASVDGSQALAIPMSQVGGDQWEAALPGANCKSRIVYWVSASDLQGRTFTDPATAPADTHVAYVTTAAVPVFTDGFGTNLGWTVQNESLSAGAWTRGDPRGTGAQPEEGDPEGSVACYFTGQGSVGGSIGEADVDGGPTRLVSPSFDFSGGDGLIHYSRWFFNDNLDGDALVVEVSNDGGGAWFPVETVVDRAGGWVRRAFRVSDHVVPTGQVRVRFSVDDEPNSSVTEAAIDEVRAERLECDPASIVLTIDPTFAGTPTRFITSGAEPFEGLILGYSKTGVGSGPCLLGGALCLDLVGNIFLLGFSFSDGGGYAVRPVNVPAHATGLGVHAQAVIFRGAGGVDSVASNAYSIVVQ